MLVVPTYNGYWHLSKLIESIDTYGTNGHDLLVVDNGTKDLVSTKFLEKLSKRFKVERNKYGKYETSALVHAVREYPNEEKFLLLHDSCIATSDKWVSQFEEKLTNNVGMVSWIKFKPCLFFMFERHFQYMDKICSHSDVPDGGVFGSIFMTHGEILRNFDSMGYFKHLPSEKHHSEAWERIWAILFHINGYKIESLIEGFDPNKIHYGQLPNLRKTFGGRG